MTASEVRKLRPGHHIIFLNSELHHIEGLVRYTYHGGRGIYVIVDDVQWNLPADRIISAYNPPTTESRNKVKTFRATSRRCGYRMKE